MFFRFKKRLGLGQWGERTARDEYKKRGYSVLSSNFFNRSGKRIGEIDIVVRDKTKIIFIEVKTRTKTQQRFGTPSEAVDIFKQRKLLKVVKIFLAKHPQFSYLRPQIDVCIVEVDNLDRTRYSVTIIPNAVEDGQY